MKKSIFVLIAVFSLAGCASQLQAVKGFNAAAAVSLKAAEDVNLERQVFEICATPLSAAIRNPQIIPGLRYLCLPGAGETSPILLLQTAKP